MKKYIFVVILLLLLLAGCKKKETVKIIGETTVEVGEQIVFSIETSKKNYMPKWYSYYMSIATIDNYGVLTAKKAGTTKVSLVIDDLLAQIDVTVVEYNLNISGESEMKIGETFKVDVSHNFPDDKNIVFSSSDSSIATIDNDGNVLAIKEGEVTITASLDKYSDSLTIKVVKSEGELPNPPKKLEVEIPEYIVYGDVVYVKANQEVIWESSDTNILTINEDGEVVVIDMGVVEIKAIKKDNKDSYVTKTVTVTSGIAPSGLEIYNDNNITQVKVRDELILKFRLLGDQKQVDSRVVWESSDSSIARIDNRGILVAVKVGKVTITVSSVIDPTIKSSITIEVIG